MCTNMSAFSMLGMADGSTPASMKATNPVETNAESVEGDPTPDDANAEMVIKPFEELSNPQGYTIFSPF
jgi:hypothetical protein